MRLDAGMRGETRREGETRSRLDPGPPPEAPKEYSKKSEVSAGVINMIYSIIADLDKELTEAATEEKLAQEEYEELMADSAKQRAADSKSVTDKAALKGDTEEALVKQTEEHKDTVKMLMATEGYISQLHAECDWLIVDKTFILNIVIGVGCMHI